MKHNVDKRNETIGTIKLVAEKNGYKLQTLSPDQLRFRLLETVYPAALDARSHIRILTTVMPDELCYQVLKATYWRLNNWLSQEEYEQEIKRLTFNIKTR